MVKFEAWEKVKPYTSFCEPMKEFNGNIVNEVMHWWDSYTATHPHCSNTGMTVAAIKLISNKLGWNSCKITCKYENS